MNKYKIQEKLFNIYCLYDVIMMSLHQKMNPQMQRKIQNRKLRKLVKTAYKNPFYKERFDNARVRPEDIKTKEDLKRLPVLTKGEYREWMLNELKKPETQFFKLTHTSGSTGIPTTNIFPPREYATHYMADFFGWIKGGYNPFWGKSLTKQPGDAAVGMNSFVQKLGILRRECFDTRWERKSIIEKINNYKPDFILANSSELLYIAQYSLEHEIPLCKPKYYCPNGENIEGLAEKRLRDVYGDGLINLYGCTEMGSFATRGPEDSGYYITEDLVVANVVDDNGSGEGNLLVTPLYRTYYPLINYEIGDVVHLEVKGGLDYISRIKGRKEEAFVWEDGSQTIFMRLYDITKELSDIYQIRFIQESCEKVIFQVVRDTSSEESYESLEKYLRKMYRSQFPQDIKIEIQWLKVIPPDPNGKIRMMISKI